MINMEKINSHSSLEFKIVLNLTEVEARALQALTVYGAPAFLKYFYCHLGKSYLQPHEKGLVDLFETIESELPAHLNRMDETRKIWTK